jgi:tetraacyldisaccharide 4'-kinase
LASGIGHPAAFEDLARRLGLDVRAACRFPDHHHFTQAEADALAARGLPLVVTGKDAVKLAALPKPPVAWVLEARHELAEDGPTILGRLVDEVLSARR